MAEARTEISGEIREEFDEGEFRRALAECSSPEMGVSAIIHSGGDLK